MKLCRMTKFLLLGVVYQIMKTKILFQNICIITKVAWDAILTIFYLDSCRKFRSLQLKLADVII